MTLLRSIFAFVLIFFTTVSKAQTSLLDSIINKEDLRSYISYLASDSMQGRYTGTMQADHAARFIASQFQKFGTSPVAGYDGYFMKILNSLGNVMSVLPGKTLPEEIVIFSAHYDHVGTKSSLAIKFDKGASDTIYNGANDNASGVSAILSLAKYFAELGNNERTIMFIAFTGEELGLLGSHELAPLLDSSKIMAVFNIDMIGGGLRPYISGDRYSNLRTIMNKALYEADADAYGKNYFMADRFANEKLFSRSDNYPFALKGIPAHTIMNTDPANYYYHTSEDEIRNINFEKLARVIRAIALASRPIISGNQTPNRIF